MQACEAKAVIIVEDDLSMNQALGRILRLGGFRTLSYASAEALLAVPGADGAKDAKCLVIDIQLPGINGFALCERLLTMMAIPPVIFMTAFDEPETRAEAARCGALAFLAKPFSGKTLLEAISRCPATSEPKQS
jgi:FixJ family two-component response regulator